MLANLIRLIILFMLLQIALSGCATQRTRWTDPVMRLAVLAEDANTYAEVQTAFMQSGKFALVDRSSGFFAAMQEQDFNQTDRVNPKERFARLGRMYGVGGLAVTHVNCIHHADWTGGFSMRCSETIAIVSTSTGEVIAAAKAEVSTPADMAFGHMPSPSWQEAVEAVEENFPSHFVKPAWSDKMQAFRNGEIDEVNP